MSTSLAIPQIRRLSRVITPPKLHKPENSSDNQRMETSDFKATFVPIVHTAARFHHTNDLSIQENNLNESLQSSESANLVVGNILLTSDSANEAYCKLIVYACRFNEDQYESLKTLDTEAKSESQNKKILNSVIKILNKIDFSSDKKNSINEVPELTQLILDLAANLKEENRPVRLHVVK